MVPPAWKHPVKKDIVIGIDSSTSATKATAWTRVGELVAEGRTAIPMSNPATARFEQDPHDWWGSTVGALKILLDQIAPERVAAVAISNQRETFGVFDAAGSPIYPGMVWLDSRAMIETSALAAQVGGERMHGICGKPVDVIVPINRMVWLREHEPEVYARIAHYADVHCYLTYKLTGQWATSRASADPSGMLDMQSGEWSEELLSAARIPPSIMPRLAAPGEVMGFVSAAAARETGLAVGTPVVAGGGDGQCAAAGAGAVEPEVAYINLGTAIVAGVYSATYRHDMAFRTETAIADGGFIFETVLKSGAFLIDWFVREMAGVSDDDRASFLAKLESEAAAVPIGADGIVVLPFWQGSMTPHWDAQARGVIAGLSGSTKRGHVYRALLEGLALDQAFALDRAQAAVGVNLHHLVAIGGGAASKLLLQILADAINVPVHKADIPEASALGAAICAAKGAGWYADLQAATDGMRQKNISVIHPIPKNVERYRLLRDIYDDLWPAIQDWNKQIWSFANEN